MVKQEAVDCAGYDGGEVDQQGGEQVGCGGLVGFVDDQAYSNEEADPVVLSQVLSLKYDKL